MAVTSRRSDNSGVMSKLKDDDAIAEGIEEVENEDEDEDEPIEGIEFVNYVDERQLDDVMRLVGRDLSEPYSVFTYRYFLHQWPELCILAVPKANGNVTAGKDGGDDDERRRPIGCVVCKIDTDDDDGGAAEKNAGGTAAADEDFLPENVPSPTLSTTAHEGGGNKGPKHHQSSSTSTRRQFPGSTGYIGMLAVNTSRRRSGVGTALAQRAIRRMRDMGCASVRLEAEVSNRAAMGLYEDRLGFMREELLAKYYLNWGDAYRLRLWFD